MGTKDDTHARVVFAGHVDHGKSSIVGRLLVDGGGIAPEKVEQVRNYCERNARPFEYAFLLDALSTERAQGITIDSASIVFRAGGHEVALVDAPGHEDFLRNMVTGASYADAAFLVLDAVEGIRTTTEIHTRLLPLLGVDTIFLLVNKMDRVGYSEEIYEQRVAEFRELGRASGTRCVKAVPVSAVDGDNISAKSVRMPWYTGPALSELVQGVRRAPRVENRPARFFVQDVYKFTGAGDDRRIVAAMLQDGTLRAGDELLFSPSNKRARVRSVEGRLAGEAVRPGEAFGVTLEEQIFITRGQLASKVGESSPQSSTRLRAQVFWFGEQPLVAGADLSMLLGTSRASITIESVEGLAGACELHKGEAGNVSLRARKAVAFDPASSGMSSARFALSSGYALCGGGRVLEALSDACAWARERARSRESRRDLGLVTAEMRAELHRQKPALVLVTGLRDTNRKDVARRLDRELFDRGRSAYFLSVGNLIHGVDSDLPRTDGSRGEHFRRLGEVANIVLGAGLILCVSAAELRQDDLDVIRALVDSENIFVVWCGPAAGTDLRPDIVLSDIEPEGSARDIVSLLEARGVIYEKSSNGVEQ